MKSKLLIVACLVIVLSMALILPLSIVNADYSDIVNDPNSIVNFNQIVNIIDASGSTAFTVLNGNQIRANRVIEDSTVRYFTITPFDLVSGHKYYGYENNAAFRFIDTTNGAPHEFSGIFIGDGLHYDVMANYRSYGTLEANRVYTFNIIDLSVMFGLGSEPSLAQCQELFVADYYSFNTGSPLAIGNLQGYAQGMADAYSSMDITLSSYLVGSSAFAFNNNTITDSSFVYSNNLNAYVATGVIGVPLLDTVNQGTNFDVDFSVWNTTSGESQSYYMSFNLNFGYVDNNNNLIRISSIKSNSYLGGGNVKYLGAFNLPIATDTIYIWITDSLDVIDTSQYIYIDSNITFRSYNVAAMIKTAYAQGYESVISYYQQGGQGYHDIYELGYRNGQNEANDYTFGALMTSVVEAPVNAVLGMFNFDFLGYNFRNVITLIITLLIILAIVRLFIGMGASE